MDWLDPQPGTYSPDSIEDPIFCLSCQCYIDHRDRAQGPESNCASEVCACHAVYWMTVPELRKRAVWGDR